MYISLEELDSSQGHVELLSQGLRDNGNPEKWVRHLKTIALGFSWSQGQKGFREAERLSRFMGQGRQMFIQNSRDLCLWTLVHGEELTRYLPGLMELHCNFELLTHQNGLRRLPGGLGTINVRQEQAKAFFRGR